jgi:hypothetical protein
MISIDIWLTMACEVHAISHWDGRRKETMDELEAHEELAEEHSDEEIDAVAAHIGIEGVYKSEGTNPGYWAEPEPPEPQEGRTTISEEAVAEAEPYMPPVDPSVEPSPNQDAEIARGMASLHRTSYTKLAENVASQVPGVEWVEDRTEVRPDVVDHTTVWPGVVEREEF